MCHSDYGLQILVTGKSVYKQEHRRETTSRQTSGSEHTCCALMQERREDVLDDSDLVIHLAKSSWRRRMRTGRSSLAFTTSLAAGRAQLSHVKGLHAGLLPLFDLLSAGLEP